MKNIKPDIDLLCNVLRNQSESYDSEGQHKFALWIIQTLNKINPDFIYEFDDYGNLYITKGISNLYPCIVAHLDTVHKNVDNFIIKKVGEFIMAFDGDFGLQTGCGADDRVKFLTS